MAGQRWHITVLLWVGLFTANPGSAQTYFTAQTTAWGAQFAPGYPTWADLDNDGWPDLFYSEIWPIGADVYLLHHEGNGRFVDWGTALPAITY